jgi:HSP20 family protein
MRLVRYTYPNYRTFAPAANGLPRSPWSGLETEISRLYEAALSDFNGALTSTQFPVDLYEDKENTYVRAELPGVSREDISVEVVDGTLTLTAVRKTPAAPATGTDQAGTPTAPSCSFSRSVTLSDEVQADKISAAYENGILTVTLPKREEAKPKKITVVVK